jgi:hypothetical protein
MSPAGPSAITLRRSAAIVTPGPAALKLTPTEPLPVPTAVTFRSVGVCVPPGPARLVPTPAPFAPLAQQKLSRMTPFQSWQVCTPASEERALTRSTVLCEERLTAANWPLLWVTVTSAIRPPSLFRATVALFPVEVISVWRVAPSPWTFTLPGTNSASVPISYTPAIRTTSSPATGTVSTARLTSQAVSRVVQFPLVRPSLGAA